MRLGYKVKGTKCNLLFKHFQKEKHLDADYYEGLKKIIDAKETLI